jgi:plastocyanin
MLFAVTLVMLAYAVPADAQTGDLKIRFQYGGDVPKQNPINATADAAFCGQKNLMDESLVVNPENKGIQNMIVAAYTGRGGSKFDAVAPAKNELTLANKDCRFEPHVVIAQVGDTLKITNPDPIGHNANVGFLMNTAFNQLIPPGQEIDVELKEAEPAAITVTCNIHPWMKAYLVVTDHPYAAVSDENGEIVIKNIPVGKQVFRANHDSLSVKEVSVNGKDEEWDRNRFEVDIKPGMNDLGTVIVPALAP